MTNIFYLRTQDQNGVNGIRLSLNDASLPFGGLLDNGTADRSSKCHETHRTGVDIDINTGKLARCPDPYNLLCPHGLTLPSSPAGETREQLLTRIVQKELNGKKMMEGNLHYRFLENPH